MKELRKKEKSNNDRIPCLVASNRKLTMCKIINKYLLKYKCSLHKSGYARNISEQFVCGI